MQLSAWDAPRSKMDKEPGAAARRVALVVALLSLLASCARPVQPLPPIDTAQPPAPIDTRGARVYTVEAASSRVHILVYRGGALARLGHNHVVTSRSVAGRIWLHQSFERSGFELTIPVASLVVDDPDDRAAHGDDFPPGISQKDIDGTKRNLLRAEVLDGAQFPTIALRSARVSGSVDAPDLSARITLKGVTRDVPIPVTLEIEEGHLTAKGALDILQTDFGIKPFSIALGALEVQDRLHLEFEITARDES